MSSETSPTHTEIKPEAEAEAEAQPEVDTEQWPQEAIDAYLEFAQSKSDDLTLQKTKMMQLLIAGKSAAEIKYASDMIFRKLKHQVRLGFLTDDEAGAKYNALVPLFEMGIACASLTPAPPPPSPSPDCEVTRSYYVVQYDRDYEGQYNARETVLVCSCGEFVVDKATELDQHGNVILRAGGEEFILAGEPDIEGFIACCYGPWKKWDELYGQHDEDRTDYEPWGFLSRRTIAAEYGLIELAEGEERIYHNRPWEVQSEPEPKPARV